MKPMGTNAVFFGANDAYNILFTVDFILIKSAQIRSSMSSNQKQYLLSMHGKCVFKIKIYRGSVAARKLVGGAPRSHGWCLYWDIKYFRHEIVPYHDVVSMIILDK